MAGHVIHNSRRLAPSAGKSLDWWRRHQMRTRKTEPTVLQAAPKHALTGTYVPPVRTSPAIPRNLRVADASLSPHIHREHGTAPRADTFRPASPRNRPVPHADALIPSLANAIQMPSAREPTPGA
jgi:hypothetical protein